MATFGLHFLVKILFVITRYILGYIWQKLGDILLFSSGNTG
jgi:hypothetical protein